MAFRWVLAVRWTAVALVVAYALLSLVVARNLAALGSWTFVDSLTSGGFWSGDPYRFIGSHLAQAPIALALEAGVTDVGVLRYAHGIGYLLIPAGMWASALILLRRSMAFELILLAYGATALTCDYIAVADVNLLFSSTALVFAISVRYFTEGGKALPWLAFIVSWVAAFTHGFALLLAPLLIAAIVLLRSRSPQREVPRLPWTLTMTVLVVGTVVSAISVLFPYSPANVAAASDPSAPFRNPQVLLMLGWLLLLPLATLPASRPVRVVATAILVGSLAWFVLDAGLWPTPVERHASRGASAMLLAVLLIVALVVVMRSMRALRPAEPRATCVLLPFAITVALLVPLVAQAQSFAGYLQDFQAAISGRTGLIPYDEFLREVPDVATYEWPYSLPTMSVVLGMGREHAIVETPVDSIYITAFDVSDPPELSGRFTGSVVGG